MGLVRTKVLEEFVASTFRVERISALGKLALTVKVVSSAPILSTLKMEAKLSSEISVLTRSARRHILEDSILHRKYDEL